MCQDENKSNERNLAMKVVDDIASIRRLDDFEPRGENNLEGHHCQTSEA